MSTTSVVVEERRIRQARDVSADIAQSLVRRAVVGPVAILTAEPVPFLSGLGRRWATLIRQLEVKQSMTLDADKRAALAMQIAEMRSDRFSYGPPKDAADGGVFVMRPGEATEVLPLCATV